MTDCDSHGCALSDAALVLLVLLASVANAAQRRGKGAASIVEVVRSGELVDCNDGIVG